MEQGSKSFKSLLPLFIDVYLRNVLIVPDFVRFGDG